MEESPSNECDRAVVMLFGASSACLEAEDRLRNIPPFLLGGVRVVVVMGTGGRLHSRIAARASAGLSYQYKFTTRRSNSLHGPHSFLVRHVPDNVHGRIRYPIQELIQHILEVEETLSIRDVVYQNTDVRLSIVQRRHGSKFLLSCRIPNLKLDLDSMCNDFRNVQLTLESRCWIGNESFLDVPQYQGRLAGIYISEKDDFGFDAIGRSEIGSAMFDRCREVARRN